MTSVHSTALGKALLAGVMGVVMLSGSAGAEPFAGIQQSGAASIHVKGTDRLAYDISIEVQETQGSASAASLHVSIQGCKGSRCKVSEMYAIDLDPEAFSVDPDGSAATLDTEFAGRPLTISWTGEQGPSVVVGAYPPNSLKVGFGGDATASVNILGIGCNDAGEIGHTAAVEADYTPPAGNPEPSAPPKGLKPRKGKKPACQS